MHALPRSLTVVVAITLAADAAVANIVVSNLLDENVVGSTASVNGGSEPLWMGQAFRTGLPGSPLALGSVVLSGDLGDAAEAELFGEIRLTDTNTYLPITGNDGLVASLTATNLGNHQLLLTLPAESSTVTLAADTAYFLILGTTFDGPNAFMWDYTSGDKFVEGAGSIPLAESESIYYTWANSSDLGASWDSDCDYGSPQLFAIYDTVVPEPASLALLALASAGLMTRRRSR